MSKSSRASITRGLRCPKFGQALQNGKRLYFYSEGKQKARVEAVCANLYHQPSIVESHLQGLHHTLSKLVIRVFRPTERMQKIMRETFRILGHLPTQLLQMVDLPTRLVLDFLVPYPEAIPWGNVRVTAYLSSNVVRAALLALLQSGISLFALLNDMIGNILESASQLSSHAIFDSANRRWSIPYQHPGSASE